MVIHWCGVGRREGLIVGEAAKFSPNMGLSLLDAVGGLFWDLAFVVVE